MTPCFQIEVREAYAHLLKHGWLDSVRAIHPGGQIYTFWVTSAMPMDGMPGCASIICSMSPSLADRLVSAGVDREVRGWQKTSDHAPTWVEIKDS